MPFVNSNDQITGRRPPRVPAGVDIVHVRFALPMLSSDMALNQIGQIGVLPGGCIPIDVRIGGSDPDASTAALVMQVGIWDGVAATLSTAAADGGAHWGVSAAVTADFDQALIRNGRAMMLVTPTDADRRIGVRITTAPTTFQAWTMVLDLWYRNG